MGRYLITAFLACLIISYTSVSTAETQKPPDVPRLFGTFAPRPGAWSEYAIFDMTTGGKTVMRLSIVGVTGESYWYEVVNREGESRNIVKMLLKGDPGDPENILGSVFARNQNGVRRLNDDEVVDTYQIGHQGLQSGGPEFMAQDRKSVV